MYFGYFTNEIECKKSKQGVSNKMVVLNETSGLTFEYKKCLENEFQNKFYNSSISIIKKANLPRKSPICSP